MATTITKGLIGKEDLSIGSSTTQTFSRATSSGGTQTMTKLGRHTFATREYDVTQFGAVGDGTTDDTAAIQAAITAAQTAGGGIIVFPAGYTFLVLVPTANTAVFTLASSNLRFYGPGATVKVKCVTANQPTSAANQREGAWLFRATGYDHIAFEGLTFDGNRTEAAGGYIDPRYGVFFGNRCNYVAVQNVTFRNFSTPQGIIASRANDQTEDAPQTNATIKHWDISHNTVEFSFAGFILAGPLQNVQVTHNNMRLMDLAPDVATVFTYSGGGGAQTIYPRAIKIVGYDSVSAASTDTNNDIDISHNTIAGAAVGVEAWNNDTSGSGSNPANAFRLNVSDNTIRALYGVSCPNWSNSTYSRNSWTNIVESELTAYVTAGGRTWTAAGVQDTMTNTGVPVGIEARPGYNNLVEGNVLDGGWVNSYSSGQTIYGIIFGNQTTSSTAVREQCVVRGNTIRRCYFGIAPNQCENSVIEGNYITETRGGIQCRFDATTGRISASGFTWANNVCRGNTVISDATSHSTGGNGGFPIILQGDWLCENNYVLGQSATVSGGALMLLQGFASVHGGAVDISNFIVRNNVFKRYSAAPVHQYGSATQCVNRVHYDGNHFDSEQSSPDAYMAPIRINRPLTGQTTVVTAGTNTAVRHRRIIQWDQGASLGTETYDFGRWVTGFTDSSTQQMSTNDSAVAYTADAPVDISYGITGVVRGKSILVQTNGGAATEVVSNFIPANCILLGGSARVNTTIVMGGGGTTWALGTSGDPWLFGTGFALTAATMTSIGSQTLVPAGGPRTIGATAENLVLTCNAGTFTSGYVLVQIQYILMTGEVQ